MSSPAPRATRSATPTVSASPTSRPRARRRASRESQLQANREQVARGARGVERAVRPVPAPALRRRARAPRRVRRRRARRRRRRRAGGTRHSSPAGASCSHRRRRRRRRRAAARTGTATARARPRPTEQAPAPRADHRAAPRACSSPSRAQRGMAMLFDIAILMVIFTGISFLAPGSDPERLLRHRQADRQGELARRTRSTTSSTRRRR